MRTSALFDPITHGERYVRQNVLLPADVGRRRERSLHDNNDTYVWDLRVSGPNHTQRTLHLAAKRFESMELAEKEYELGAGLVEPPQWRELE